MNQIPVIDMTATGRNIVRLRKQAGLTVRDIQDAFGFSNPQAIYKWQHGECLPTVDNLLALARLLQVPMEDLLVYEDQGVSHILYRNLNHRFNDKQSFSGYHRNTEGEKWLLPKKSGREPTSVNEGFPAGGG